MPNVIYICDRKACKNCSFPVCAHTTDIDHAINFSRIRQPQSEGQEAYAEHASRPDCSIELGIIRNTIGPVASWLQLAEEAAELSQAAAKLARFYEGHNPVAKDICDQEKLLKSAQEEFTDVIVSADALKLDIDSQMYTDKVDRWSHRVDG